MKLEFHEQETGVNFWLTAETVKEAALLVRMQANALKEAPLIQTSFHGDSIGTLIAIPKKTNQKTHLGNDD